MILDYQTIISKITESSGLSKDEIETKIQSKIAAYQDLISREGAAHMVANELNVKLFDSTNKTLKIRQIQPGLNSINVLGKVVTEPEVKSFQKNDRQGRIGSLMIGDETGTIRTVFWDEKLIDLLKDIHEGSILKINNAYVKQNSVYREIHVGGKAQLLINPENETIEDVKISIISNRKQIQDLTENEFVEIFGTIVQVFEPKYYNSCPICNKKVNPQGEFFVCIEHNQVPPKQCPILNLFFDDGTGSIRAVLFRDQVTKLTNNKTNLEEIKKEVLGRQLIFKGKVNKNEMFNRIELTVNSFEEAQPDKLLEEIELT